MGKYFGTDGIRGKIGEPIGNMEFDALLAYATGRAAATAIISGRAGGSRGKKPRVMIAKDTRISGDMLVSAMAAGLASAGADVIILGVLPTPAVAYLTKKSGADIGAVISASHNPYEDNGIKLFGKDGLKLSDAIEERIEELIDDDKNILKPDIADMGRVRGNHGRWVAEYVDYIASKAETRFRGKVAIDCSNGATYETARSLFMQLGVNFDIFHDTPNGVNINHNCGSTHISELQRIMVSGGFDIGISFDGDADRCILVDEFGEVIDGDVILAVCAKEMKAQGKLRGNAVVGTTVSNSGMDVYAKKHGFDFHRADVGDRNVLEMMMMTGAYIGGESSGHMIFLDDHTTGDGQLTAIKFLNIMAATGKTASQLAADFPYFPQVMPSYHVTGGADQKEAIMANPKLHKEIERLEKELEGRGRVFVRPSGTEALIRVLVEAETKEFASEKANHLIKFIETL
jgi:phosphoglucosamine mutase